MPLNQCTTSPELDMSLATPESRANQSDCSEYSEQVSLYLVPNCATCEDTRNYFLGTCSIGEVNIKFGNQQKEFKSLCGKKYTAAPPDGELSVQTTLSRLMADDLRFLIWKKESQFINASSGVTYNLESWQVKTGQALPSYDIYILKTANTTDLDGAMWFRGAEFVGVEDFKFSSSDVATPTLMFKFSQYPKHITL